MRNIIFFLAIALVFTACPDGVDVNGKADLDIKIKAKYGNETLVLDNYYDYTNGNKINFSRLTFFLSEITLLNGGEATEILDIGLVDLYNNHTDASTASNGELIEIENIPEGTYTGIRFGIGVAPALNAQNPADFANNHPLSNTENYWDWRESFIFTKLEGHVDTVGNSSKLDVFFTYHPGEESYYKTINLDTPITLENKSTTELSLLFDAKTLFLNSGTTFDLITNNQSHTGVDDAWIIDQIMTNYLSAFSVE